MFVKFGKRLFLFFDKSQKYYINPVLYLTDVLNILLSGYSNVTHISLENKSQLGEKPKSIMTRKKRECLFVTM